MKFSQQTLSILKNFQNINKSLLFKPGSELRTISQVGTIFAVAKIEENIPKEAGIYELSKLLSVISLYDDPEIKFGDNSFEITDNNGKKKTRLTYTDSSMIHTPPSEKTPKMNDIDVQFNLSAEDFIGILKAGANLGLQDFTIVADGEKMYVGVSDTDNATSDNYYVELGETENSFRYVVKTEYLKFIHTDYVISIDDKKVTFDNGSVIYYIALESKKTIKMRK